MAMPTKPNSHFGNYVLKTFKDESFRAYVPPLLPPDPPASKGKRDFVALDAHGDFVLCAGK